MVVNPLFGLFDRVLFNPVEHRYTSRRDVIHQCRPVTDPSPHGGNKWRNLVWSTPNGRERRSVPFPAVLTGELAALMVGKEFAQLWPRLVQPSDSRTTAESDGNNFS